MPNRTKIEIGKKFGLLTILSEAGLKGKDLAVNCQCDCGNKTITRYTKLKMGVTSCGCLRIIAIAKANSLNPKRLKHGMKTRTGGSPEYNSWASMKQRCLNPNFHHWKDYGGRGIQIHPDWIDDFQQFLEDMGPRPKGTTLERKDVHGYYTKDNCKWGTVTEQANNRRGIADR